MTAGESGHARSVTTIPDSESALAPGEPDAPGPAAPTVTTADPPQCPTRTRAYRGGKVIAEGFPAEKISDFLDEHEDTVVWLDLRDPDAHDLQIVVQEFGLHPLAIEDAITDHQRPKLDRYESHLFLNAYAVAVDEASAEVVTNEVSVFITARALITVRKEDTFDVDQVVTRWDGAAELASHGVGFLLHGLLDAIVDGHYAAVERLDDALELLEDQLFAPRPTLDIRRRGFELRKAVVRLRRVIVPMREVVEGVQKPESNLVDETMAPYYQDVHDHVLRVAESTDALRDHATTILESHRSEQSYQLNEVTKKLAGWAAIIAVPTAITGYYGQNVPYPGYSQHWGFLVSTVVIVLMSGALYFAFRRRGWL
jgi:magnesium transporter